MRPRAIPLGDAATLRLQRHRTRVERLVLALALIGIGIATYFFAGAPAASTEPLLNGPSRGIVVLDLSASVETSELQLMYTNLMRLADSDGRYGLVAFSDQAYEMLPPGTPSSALKQMAYFFHPVRRPVSANGATAQPSAGVNVNTTSPIYPVNPWASGYTLGTQISMGLNLAAQIIENGNVNRTVWLISDLGDDPPDLPLVAGEAKVYAQEGIKLNVLALDPTKKDARFFDSLVTGPGTGSLPPRVTARTGGGTGQALPLGLAVAVILMGVLLAANELRSTPLRWGVSSLERSA